MKKTFKKALVSAAGLFAALSWSQSSFAVEPTDNNPPWGSPVFAGNATVYECPVNAVCAYSLGDEITSGDQDWLYLTCGNGKVTQVQIVIQYGPFSGSGDLDIDVYKPNTTIIGASHGTTQTETVNTSAANLSSVILNVHGYISATNTYQVRFTCG